MAALRGRWWSLAALTLWAGSTLPETARAWACAAALGCVVVAWRVARRGPTLVAPGLLVAGVLLLASVRPHRPPAAVPRRDLPMARTQAPRQRLQLVTEPTPARAGCVATARWLQSCRGRCDRRTGRVQLRLPRARCGLGAGAVVWALAPVHPPPGYRNPGADGLLRRWRRLGLRGRVLVRSKAAVAVESGSAERGSWGLRARLRRGMARLAPGPSGGLLRALALGDRTGVDPGLKGSLRRTGTAHVLAVSGTHVGFVLVLALGLLRLVLRVELCAQVQRRWPRPWLDVWVGSGVCVGYAALTGGAPSTVRAATVASLALLLRAAGAVPSPVELLGCAAVLAWVVDPLAPHDAGLNLSLLGALGALAGARMPWRGGRLGRAALVSAAASCTTAWVSLPLFGALPLTAPIVNLLVVPWVGVVVLPSALALLALAWLPALPSWALPVLRGGVDAVVAPLRWFSALPASSWPCVELGGLDATVTAAGLSLGAAVATSAHRRAGLASLAVAGAALALLAWGPWRAPPPFGAVDVRVFDVGHGDATLLRFADGRTLLMDGGGEVGDDGRVGRRALVPALRALGVRRIHVMALSHAHPDHENGLLAVARAFPVDAFWFAGPHTRSREHRLLMQTLRRQGTRRWARDTLRWGGVAVRRIWPARRGLVGAEAAHLGLNDRSLVLEVDASGTRMLLAGDVEREAEAALVRAGRLRPVDVLKVPHHGSRTSSTAVFLDAVRPRLAVAGARSWGALAFPHHDVAARYRDRGVPLWRTERGVVRLRLGPRGVDAAQAGASAVLPPRRRRHQGAPKSRPRAAAQANADVPRPARSPGGWY